MSENEKGATTESNHGSIGVNEGSVSAKTGDDSESSRPATENGTDQVSISAEDVARQIQSRGTQNPNPPSEAEKRELVADYVKQAIEEGLVAYDVYAIQKTYPKAFAALQEYINQTANLPVDMDSLVGIMLYSGRTVTFPFFDDKKLFVNILGYDNKWYYTIERTCQSTEDYPSRLLCEIAAFMRAFAELERQLNYNLKP